MKKSRYIIVALAVLLISDIAVRKIRLKDLKGYYKKFKERMHKA